MPINVLSKDTRLWSFWRRGWLCVPTVIGWSDNSLIVAGRLLNEAHDRLPETVMGIGRIYRANHWLPQAYVIKRVGDNDQARYHDLRLPSSDACSGIIFVPTRSCTTSDPAESWHNRPSWDLIISSLRYLRETARPALHGELYVPLLGAADDGFDDAESLEMISDELGASRGFSVCSGERDEVKQPSNLSAPAPSPALVPQQESKPETGNLISNDFDVVPL